MTTSPAVVLVSSAAAALRERKDEVNKLNVFPVPDGDTGTNMSLTMDTVVSELGALPADADLAAVRKAVTHGSLMGARGNSGVITSQILRGLCEGLEGVETLDAQALARAFARSVEVAFQAVRKPVEGTMLTVLRDAAGAAREAADAGAPLDDALRAVSAEAFASVRRTPDLLPVLKENNVVDAGGFGLAILFEAFVAAATGAEISMPDLSSFSAAPKVAIELTDDWDGSTYLYCTEFLFHGVGIDKERVHDYLAEVGDSELIVGEGDQYKVHVHTDDPGAVLSYMTAIGQVADVHIHNMRIQSGERDAVIAADRAAVSEPAKPLGFVAVAAGEGMAKILESLGVDHVVSGGQTMNPSTKDLLDAIGAVNAEAVVVLPNNKNIIMAANAAAQSAPVPVRVVPTTSVPEAFAAMFVVDGSKDLDELVSEMTEAASFVHTGEVTRAVKDAKSKAGDITDGDVIGIADHEIEVVGGSVDEVALELVGVLAAHGGETLTLLAGEDFSDEELSALADAVEDRYPDLEVDVHRGEQPLYPVVMSVE